MTSYLQSILFLSSCGVFRLSQASPIDVAIDERKHLHHIVDSVDILIYVCLLILTIITVWIFKQKRIRILHESGLAVIYGLIVGIALQLLESSSIKSYTSIEAIQDPSQQRQLNDGNSNIPPDQIVFRMNLSHPMENKGIVKHIEEKSFNYVFSKESNEPENEIRERATFNPELFFHALLPPIIFHAGYSMRKKHFFNNFGGIMAFALIGTTISTFVIALILYAVGQIMQYKLLFLDTLYFGAIISATDPVTTLSIFQDLHVDSMLNGLVLGESLINDAVALILTTSIEHYSKVSGKKDFEVEALLVTLLKFFTIVFGSIGLGALIGMLTSILTKFTRIRDYHLLESSLFLLMSYSSYLFAEISEMSGIVSILFCGICQSHYTFKNLSEKSQSSTKQFFETINFLAENFIFCYIGVSMFTYSSHIFNGIFIASAFVAIALSRACNIYPLSAIVNCGRKKKIPLKFQHMLWFSGLRGAIAFALAVQNTVSPVRKMFFTTTCLIVIITVIVVGGSTTQVLALLQIPIGETDEEKEGLLNLETNNTEGPQSLDATAIPTPSHNSGFVRLIKNLDSKFLKPLLTITKPSLIETLPECCYPFARCFTVDEQTDSPIFDGECVSSDREE